MKFTKSSKHSDKFYCTARGRKSKLPLYDTSLLVFFFFQLYHYWLCIFSISCNYFNLSGGKYLEYTDFFFFNIDLQICI